MFAVFLGMVLFIVCLLVTVGFLLLLMYGLIELIETWDGIMLVPLLLGLFGLAGMGTFWVWVSQ